MNICVFGASSDNIHPEYIAAAEEFGRCLGQNGHTLVFGGGSHGVMGAAARGAHSGGAEIIGIAPSFFNKPGILFDRCTDFIYTQTMSERKDIMLDMSDVFAVLPGGMGTYDELFEILTLRQLGKLTKPIGFLNTRSYFTPMRLMLENTAAEGFMDKRCLELYSILETPRELLEYIENTRAEAINFYKY